MSSGEGLWRGPGERPRIYGHRGVRGHDGIMENTLPAFELALDQGADGVELDVRLCASGEVVVLHDPDLARVAPAHATLVAAEATAEELAAAQVPTLDQTLERVLARAGARIKVEAKSNVPDPAALVDALVATLGRLGHGQRGRIFLSSFSRTICRSLSAVLEDMPVLWLFGKPPELPVLQDLPDAIGVHPKHTLIDRASIEAFREGGGVINAWTVNDPEEARRLASLGVDGLITDDVPAISAAVT